MSITLDLNSKFSIQQCSGQCTRRSIEWPKEETHESRNYYFGMHNNIPSEANVVPFVCLHLQKIAVKVVFRKVCLGETGEGLSSLGRWLKLSESVAEKVAVVR